jgi:hypothetical protein
VLPELGSGNLAITISIQNVRHSCAHGGIMHGLKYDKGLPTMAVAAAQSVSEKRRNRF